MAMLQGEDLNSYPPLSLPVCITPTLKSCICIIGAGVSGLCTCKHLLQQHAGLQPLILEASEGIGGVWRHTTCSSTTLQNPCHTFQFSDFPWPKNTPKHPSHHQVLDYLHNYAKHFDLITRIRFNSKVVRLVRPQKECIWEIHVLTKMDNGSLKEEKLIFNFVILCVGRFGDIPRLPSFPDPAHGPQIFKGKLLHAMQYSALDDKSASQLLKGKRTVIIGFQKSAIDIAVEVADANKDVHVEHPCTLVHRRVPWLMLDSAAWCVSLGHTRFAELATRKPGQGLLLHIISTLLYPTRWTIAKLVEFYLLWKLPLRRYNLVPGSSIAEDFASCAFAVLPQGFFPAIKEGRLLLQKSSNWHFSERGIKLQNGSEIKADVVILATGYDSEQKLKSIIPEEYRDKLLDNDAGLVPLYRGAIPPKIPDMAIFGYQETFSNLGSSEMSARWLSSLLAGKLSLPDHKTMVQESKKWIDYMASSLLPKRACTGAVYIWHADQLCKDMGWNPRRKESWTKELFSPYTNLDYKDPNIYKSTWMN